MLLLKGWVWVGGRQNLWLNFENILLLLNDYNLGVGEIFKNSSSSSSSFSSPENSSAANKSGLKVKNVGVELSACGKPSIIYSTSFNGSSIDTQIDHNSSPLPSTIDSKISFFVLHLILEVSNTLDKSILFHHFSGYIMNISFSSSMWWEFTERFKYIRRKKKQQLQTRVLGGKNVIVVW